MSTPTTSAGIQAPVPLLLQRVLRRAVREHAAQEPRRRYPAVLQAGLPGGGAAGLRRFEVRRGEPLDLALRIEVVEALCRDHLARGVVPLLWLTRPVDGPDLEDLAWAAAVGCAGPELGVSLDLVVVTRRSWRDPRSGVGRTWSRIRPTEP
ncbi:MULTISPECIES: hypothetical protein [Pimelobacter]|uniref:hypothetical protein n=1 Tax=Pimelobacter TaxID=2044 RepID=UPI001C0523AE|nr:MULTISPECIES: hypothetical protein [Pimelobacter]MBU2696498.1 hypothetical protein [Pimelobacter sp. 30-1]UUW87709.1 hypothetical protein M0M43_18415 [Pimelobacter simplex]UUW97215.1 hypothetical protein M0M48_07065 [Pimelobacter simplex]